MLTLYIATMPDSDPFLTDDTTDDFTSIFNDAITAVPYKLLFLLFLLFIIITSDVFVNRVLSRFSGAVDYKQATNYGVVIQGIMLVLAFMLAAMLEKQKII